MTKTMTPDFTAGALPGFATLAGRISAFVGTVAAARESRLALAALSDQMLADVGVVAVTVHGVAGTQTKSSPSAVRS